MANTYYNGLANCPFFDGVVLTKSGQIIATSCESLGNNLGFDVTTLVRFKSKREFDDYFHIFCADMYDTCPYYKALERKYD